VLQLCPQCICKGTEFLSVDLSAVSTTSDNISAAAPSAACLAMSENTSADMCRQFTAMSENVKQILLLLMQHVSSFINYFSCSMSAMSENIFVAVLYAVCLQCQKIFLLQFCL